MEVLGGIVGVIFAITLVGVAIALLYLWNRNRNEYLHLRRRLGLNGEYGRLLNEIRRPETGNRWQWLQNLFDDLLLGRVLRFYSRLVRRAGYRHPAGGAIFLAAKIFIILVLLFFFRLVESPIQGYFHVPGNYQPYLFVVILTWLFTDLILWRQVQNYRRLILTDLPFWLDLHTTLLEGGMGFDESLARVNVEGEHRNRPLFIELAQVYRLIHLGSSRTDALRSMSDALQIDALDVVVSCIIQGEIMGVGMVDTLRAQADMARNQVWEDALADAQRLPVELVFPMALAILPSLFLIMMGPPLLQLLDFFGG